MGEGRRARGAGVRLGLAMLLGLIPVACGQEDRPTATPSALDDDAITVGSFDFAESGLLAEIYGQALEGERFSGRAGRRARAARVRRARPVARPGRARARVRGHGAAVPQPRADRGHDADIDATHEAAQPAAARRAAPSALAPAPAQDANAFVVTPEVRRALRSAASLSDLAAVARELTLRRPARVPQPAALPRGPRTGVRAASSGAFVAARRRRAHHPPGARTPATIDVALLFTTDPAIDTDDLVELADDRHLQPAENVTPLVRTEVVDRWGDDAGRPRSTRVSRAADDRRRSGSSNADVPAADLARDGRPPPGCRAGPGMTTGERTTACRLPGARPAGDAVRAAAVPPTAHAGPPAPAPVRRTTAAAAAASGAAARAGSSLLGLLLVVADRRRTPRPAARRATDRVDAASCCARSPACAPTG